MTNMESTGCYFIGEDECLWLAVSYRNEFDFVWTEFFKVEE
jgi:hypothetical protein